MSYLSKNGERQLFLLTRLLQAELGTVPESYQERIDVLMET